LITSFLGNLHEFVGMAKFGLNAKHLHEFKKRNE
ncbi:MAG: hypothetical protein QG591_536, partial [Planctomycetota bacterium]|nr:hypothetical protein [Planctomycetota bacterium]